MALTELGLDGVARADRDETFAGKSLFVAKPLLTALGLSGVATTYVDVDTLGADPSQIFPLYLYLDSVSVIGR